jgi:hypothetical protein
LPIDFPDDKTMRISHEAIYQALFWANDDPDPVVHSGTDRRWPASG